MRKHSRIKRVYVAIIPLLALFLVSSVAFAFQNSAHNFVVPYVEIDEEKDTITRAMTKQCDLAMYDSWSNIYWCYYGSTLYAYLGATDTNNNLVPDGNCNPFDSMASPPVVKDMWVTSSNLYFLYEDAGVDKVRKLVGKACSTIVYSEYGVQRCVSDGIYSYCVYDDDTNIGVIKYDANMAELSRWTAFGASDDYPDSISYSNNRLYFMQGEGNTVVLRYCTIEPNCGTIIDDHNTWQGYYDVAINWGTNYNDVFVWEKDGPIDSWLSGVYAGGTRYPGIYGNGRYYAQYGNMLARYSITNLNSGSQTAECEWWYPGYSSYPLAGVFKYDTLLMSNRLVQIDSYDESCIDYGGIMYRAYDVCRLSSDSLDHYVCYDSYNKYLDTLDIYLATTTTTTKATTTTTRTTTTTTNPTTIPTTSPTTSRPTTTTPTTTPTTTHPTTTLTTTTIPNTTTTTIPGPGPKVDYWIIAIILVALAIVYYMIEKKEEKKK